MDLDEDPVTPVYVLTTTPACLAACLVRMMARSTRTMLWFLQTRLAQLVIYNLYDMRYEGDYMRLEEETQEELDQQMQIALEQFRKWEGWREDEMWIADALEAIIQGKGRYEDLTGRPSNT